MERRRFKVPTRDGRWLMAEMAGPENGDIVIFHTGTPGSCYLYEGQVKECAKWGLRLVCASRPGYDGSPRLQGRSYADNSADTLAVMECLGVESVYVIGHSGGGGPAFADAASLPERVRAVAVIATFAPRRAMGPGWWRGLTDANGEELQAIQAGEATLRRTLKEAAEEMRDMESGEDITSHPKFSKLFAPVDRACFVGEFLDYQLKSYWRIHRGLEGWIDDDFALYNDWGFDLAEIRVPVSIRQGGHDNIIPTLHTEWLASQVPGARFHLLPDEGHVSLMTRGYGAILDELIELGT